MKYILEYKEFDNLSIEEQEIKDNAIFNNTFMKAPNGRKTKLTQKQWLQVRTKNFINWFGDWINDPDKASKVVDINGEPLVVYHGTSNDFDVFHQNNPYSYADDGANFFTSDINLASKYGDKIISVYLCMVDPEVEDAYGETFNDYANVSTGLGMNEYSETIIKNIKDSPKGTDKRIKAQNLYIVGNELNNQIKSATHNNGDFDINNENIYK